MLNNLAAVHGSTPPIVVTGGTLFTSGGFNYRLFTGNGTLTVTGGTLTADILLIGGGGREHALALKLSESELCTHVFIAPGNPGTAQIGTNVDISVNDFEAQKSFCLEHKIEMV